MKLIELQGALTAPCGYKWYSNGKSRFNKNYKHYLIKEDKIMTREDKLWTMRMVDLKNLADKLGIKINTKAAKEKAIAKILEAENANKTEETAPEVKPENPKTETTPEPTPEPKTEPKTNDEVKLAKKSEKRNNLKLSELTYKGETKSIKAWAEEIGMPTPTLYDRVNRNGWTVEEAIETPLGERRKKS